MRLHHFFSKRLCNMVFFGLLITVFLITTLCCASPSFVNIAAEAGNENNDTPVKIPVVMYHLVFKKANSRNKFIISEKTLEEDFKYLSNNGFTTILVKDLIDYVENKGELPEKPIMLTFDDGAYNNYLYALPLAKKHNVKFVFSPIGIHADRYTEISEENPRYAHANWTHIKELADSGIVEIQNHTYDMHSSKGARLGCKKRRGESVEKYKQKLSDDLMKMQKLVTEKTGTTPTAFVYPFGAYSECSKDIVKELGFKATFLCENKMNHITRDPNSIHGLYRFLRPPGKSSEKFFDKILS